MIDPTWAAAERHAAAGASDAAQRRFFLAAGVTLGVGWSTLIAIGVVAGGRLDAVDLEVVVPLCLAALVGPALRDRRQPGRDGRRRPGRGVRFALAARDARCWLAIVAGTLTGAVLRPPRDEETEP